MALTSNQPGALSSTLDSQKVKQFCKPEQPGRTSRSHRSRRYLAALYSPVWSERLRSLYESIAGVTLDPWWDLYALLHHDDSQPKWIRGQVAGRRPVDVPGMTSRVEVTIETALRRFG
jgi:hypothetical protein